MEFLKDAKENKFLYGICRDICIYSDKYRIFYAQSDMRVGQWSNAGQVLTQTYYKAPCDIYVKKCDAITMTYMVLSEVRSCNHCCLESLFHFYRINVNIIHEKGSFNT